MIRESLSHRGRYPRPRLTQTLAFLDSPTASARPELNESQRAILRFMTEGYSNREIAERVHLSENTVKTHIQEIFRKLGVRNRVEAALRATKEGWTDGSP